MNVGPEKQEYASLIKKLSMLLIARLEYNQNELDYVLSDRPIEEKEQSFIENCPDFLIKLYNRISSKNAFFQLFENAISQDIKLYQQLYTLLHQKGNITKNILSLYLIVKLKNLKDSSYETQNNIEINEKISESLSFAEICQVILDDLPGIHKHNQFYIHLLENIKFEVRNNEVTVNAQKSFEVPFVKQLETQLKVATKTLDYNINLALLQVQDTLSKRKKSLLNLVEALREQQKTILSELSNIANKAKDFKSFDSNEHRFFGAIALEMTNDLFLHFPEQVVVQLFKSESKINKIKTQAENLNELIDNHFKPKETSKKAKKSVRTELLPNQELVFALSEPVVESSIEQPSSPSLKEKTLLLAYNQNQTQPFNSYSERNQEASTLRIAQHLQKLFSVNPKLSDVESLIKKLGGRMSLCGSGSSHYKIELNEVCGYFCHKHKPGHSDNTLSDLALKNIYGTFERADIFREYNVTVEFNKLLPSTSRKHSKDY